MAMCRSSVTSVQLCCLSLRLVLANEALVVKARIVSPESAVYVLIG